MNQKSDVLYFAHILNHFSSTAFGLGLPLFMTEQMLLRILDNKILILSF